MLLPAAKRSGSRRWLVRYDADARVQGTATAYGGSMYVLNPYAHRLRKITWTRWQGHSGDGNMRLHETTDEFRRADIVLGRPAIGSARNRLAFGHRWHLETQWLGFACLFGSDSCFLGQSSSCVF